jgi:hypothetical protein
LGAAAAAFAAESGNAEVAARRWAALALQTATR